MKIYFGAAIQGNFKRDARVEVMKAFVSCVESLGHQVLTEHICCSNKEEVLGLLKKKFGKLPESPAERAIFIRDTMIQYIEGDLDAAVFEVSAPSLGTGIEIAHSYLRPKLGLKPIPILLLYEKDFWPNGLSLMLTGLTEKSAPGLEVFEYKTINEAREKLASFLSKPR
ncbi:MAG: hypothetical protein AB7F43_13560 [Bacteriovoracia bacterium]